MAAGRASVASPDSSFAEGEDGSPSLPPPPLSLARSGSEVGELPRHGIRPEFSELDRADSLAVRHVTRCSALHRRGSSSSTWSRVVMEDGHAEWVMSDVGTDGEIDPGADVPPPMPALHRGVSQEGWVRVLREGKVQWIESRVGTAPVSSEDKVPDLAEVTGAC
jgi:hypothetical protein